MSHLKRRRWPFSVWVHARTHAPSESRAPQTFNPRSVTDTKTQQQKGGRRRVVRVPPHPVPTRADTSQHPWHCAHHQLLEQRHRGADRPGRQFEDPGVGRSRGIQEREVGGD